MAVRAACAQHVQRRRNCVALHCLFMCMMILLIPFPFVESVFSFVSEGSGIKAAFPEVLEGRVCSTMYCCSESRQKLSPKASERRNWEKRIEQSGIRHVVVVAMYSYPYFLDYTSASVCIVIGILPCEMSGTVISEISGRVCHSFVMRNR